MPLVVGPPGRSYPCVLPTPQTKDLPMKSRTSAPTIISDGTDGPDQFTRTGTDRHSVGTSGRFESRHAVRKRARSLHEATTMRHIFAAHPILQAVRRVGVAPVVVLLFVVMGFASPFSGQTAAVATVGLTAGLGDVRGSGAAWRGDDGTAGRDAADADRHQESVARRIDSFCHRDGARARGRRVRGHRRGARSRRVHAGVAHAPRRR